MKNFLAPCVSVEWKDKLRKLGPRTMDDHKILRSVNCPTYFAVSQYDEVLAKVSEMGFSLEVVGEIPPSYEEWAAGIDALIDQTCHSGEVR